ncbi:MAG: hypothetical protein Q8M29_16665 [Bacteroidota bacterium]|nr:hypothetical protein [Bacteroidota bacterium]
MKIQKVIVSGLLLVLVLFFSCKKPTEVIDTCDVSAEYLSTDITKLKLKKSTYWVFIDSVSLSIDSMYVDSVLYYGMYPIKTSCPTETYEGYGIRVRSSVDTSKQDIYRLKGGSMDRNTTTLSDLNGSVYVDYNFGALPTGSTNTVVKKDSVFVYDQYYKNVVILTRPNDNTEFKKTVYYINSEFGFLKKEIYSSTNVLLSNKILKSKNIIR